MNIVFLRGAIPPASEHPEKLIYTDIEACEDMWTQLFYSLTKKINSFGEVIYVNGKRNHVIDKQFREVWVKSLDNLDINEPDLIFCRGGFQYYDEFLKRFPKSKKIYYGAGTRFYPQSKFKKYDLFLVDSIKQLNFIKSQNKNANLFFKPAARLFKPISSKKKFDICFMANATQGNIKRHELLIESFSNSNFSILNLGNIDNKYVKYAKKMNTNIYWGGWMLRKDLPSRISECKIGVCCSAGYDSCPRVIPEYLACGLPIVVTKSVNFWREKYITQKTGAIVNDNDILKTIRNMMGIKYDTVDYYNKHLSIDVASEYLCNLINKIL